MNILQNTRRVFQIRQSTIPTIVLRLQSDASIGDRPWDKSTRAVVYELPDVVSPAEIKSRHLTGMDSHSPQAYEPKSDKNAVKGRISNAHFDLRCQNWERNQNKDFRSQMRQWDIQQQVFKTSRLIKHQEYGTYESNRGNISGRPSPSNSTPMTLHQASKSNSSNSASDHDQQSLKIASKSPMTPPASSRQGGLAGGSQGSSAHTQ